MQAKERLERLMSQRGLNQAELAAELGCSRSFLNQVLNGKKRLSLTMVQRASDYFGVPIGNFFREESEDSAPEYLLDFYSYCEGLTSEEVAALRTVASLFPSKIRSGSK